MPSVPTLGKREPDEAHGIRSELTSSSCYVDFWVNPVTRGTPWNISYGAAAIADAQRDMGAETKRPP
ncbi:hypothetical protein CYMTET_6117 [Cymbomonas tetramitiformis]|uniref:Uncharacterized protein n=1 Tax=Cymbomonas tetramitiformis TaxID=36881 RepID=A0AAE0LIR3_9CHLO|nr:hypothetical protein CYMTET_6117 [Cymbomonas tetramitiformis]